MISLLYTHILFIFDIYIIKEIVISLDFSPDGKYLANGFWDFTVCLIETKEFTIA